MDGKQKAKRKRLIAGLSILGVAALLIAAYVWFATRPIDRILNYEVGVMPQEDGVMEITYHIRWEVLDSDREGPLTWVKLGMANDAFEVLDYGGAIRSVRSSYGTYAEFYLDKYYYKGDMADFWFTVRQERMLCANPDDPTEVFYDFVPGWFDSIDVEHYRFIWDTTIPVKGHNADAQEPAALVWEGALRRGDTRELIVRYGRRDFPIEGLTTWRPSPVTPGSGDSPSVNGSIILGIIMVLFIIEWVFILNPGGAYRRGRGYGHYHHRGGGGGGCACACAGCACACACAGGGRAGCTNKDFYQNNGRQ